MERTRVAVIGVGAMGSAVAKRLVEGPCSVVVPLEGRSQGSIERVAALGVRGVSTVREAVAFAELVLSIVPPGQARAVAQAAARAFRAGNEPKTYVDCNAIAPATSISIGDLIESAGARFVDGGIVGGPPKPGEPGPIFFVSGSGANAVEALRGAGLDIRVLGASIGAASALKMSYAGITKGLTALCALMQEHAGEYGLADELNSVLQETRPDLWHFVAGAVPAMYPKAYRWVAEMREIKAFTSPDAAAMQMYEAAAQFYERVRAADERTTE